MESKHIKADSVQQLTPRQCTPVYQETLQLEMNSVYVTKQALIFATYLG